MHTYVVQHNPSWFIYFIYFLLILITKFPVLLHSFQLHANMSPDSTWPKDFLRLLVQQGPVPKHVGFIMDGNRRYGKEHAIPLAKAYRIGAQTLENVRIPPVLQYRIRS